MTEYHNENCDIKSIRAQVFKELDQNPLNTAKNLAKLLNLPYRQYRAYLNTLRWDWKYHHKDEQGSKPSNLHHFRAWVLLRREGELDLLRVRDRLVGLGWQLSRARNRFWFLRERLGRCVWFETGLVLITVRAPGNLGKAKQLFCDCFVSRGLLSDLKVVSEVCDRIREHNVHAPYVTEQRLPKLTITDFAESHGIVIKVGDRSHPNAVEVIANWTENMMKIANFFDEVRLGMNPSQGEVGKDQKSLDRYVT